MKTNYFLFFLMALFAGNVSAQESILVINSGTKQIAQLNAVDGTVMNPAFIDMSTVSSGTIKGIAQVGDKIWISDQTQDKIHIYNLDGTFSSVITGGLDNLRGLNVVNNEVWVTNAGSGNSATANSIARFSAAGTFLGYYPSITSPFDVLDSKNGFVYISSLSNNGIQKMDYTGNVTGNFVAPGFFQNTQQINFNNAGNMIVAVFQNHSGGNNAGIYVLSITDASILNYWPVTAGQLRGTIQTGNGNYLYSTGSGVFSIDAATGTVSSVASGAYQYFTKINTAAMGTSEAKSTDVKLYPNPVSDRLYITSQKKIKDVMVYSADGKLLKKLSEVKTDLLVSDLPPGTYFMMMTIDNTQKSVKFIKK